MNRTIAILFLVLAVGILAVGCGSAQPKLMAIGEPIPPNTCRALLTVVSIDTTLHSSLADDPCSKAPCYATVQVDSVIGYGSAFTTPLAKGEMLQVQFAFTVAPTKELFPSMAQQFPGVRVRTALVADIQSTLTLKRSDAPRSKFVIYGYDVH